MDPSTTLEFLGIVNDTICQESLLPDNNLTQLQELTTCLKSHHSCTKQELESLLGVLHHACTVNPTERAFLQQVIRF